MKKNLLLPHSWKVPGTIVFLISMTLGITSLFDVFNFSFLDDTPVFAIFASSVFDEAKVFNWTTNNISDEIMAILVIISGLVVAFSKEKMEDEFIARIRLESLVKSVLLNYLILIFCILFFYDFGFYFVMVFNMFTTLLFFIIRFRLTMYLTNKQIKSNLS